MPTSDPLTSTHYWRQTRRLTLVLLLVWFVTCFGMIFFARELRDWHFFAWPLPFYALAQGLLLCFVALTFLYAFAMRRLNQAEQAKRDHEQVHAQTQTHEQDLA